MNKIFLALLNAALFISQGLFAISFQVQNQSGSPVTLQIFDAQNKSIYKKNMIVGHESGPITIPTHLLGLVKYTLGNKNFEVNLATVRVIDSPRKNFLSVEKNGALKQNFAGSFVTIDPTISGKGGAGGGALGDSGPTAATLFTYEKLKDSKVDSLKSPLLKNREGLARTDFSKLDKKNQEQIQTLSFREIADMPSDFTEYYPPRTEKSVIATYVLYDGVNTWDKTIGYLLLKVDFAKNDAYVKEFLIKQPFRDGGFGKKLFALALTDYFTNINPKGKISLYISGTLDNMQKLNAFYSKFGFKLKGKLANDGLAEMTLDAADFKTPQ